ncbi:response regulator [Pseudomonas chlororaphis]|jgi:CheY-like chemotaxis protein/chemotaxis protein CheY-P-specific phosphatase CheC|uniref:Response regulator n=1 Tax=Pseudomonas morbosilactucae TaxID=2938197 RepID=A0A9X1Z0J5_9PSED|nr:response regulator [Pseudomonas morbosilactucae]MCK9801570.1 response regulator [Pseudomonas morbosilactucae]MCK9818178.1 response regulator [Pseudomonas morbosilactucae]ROL69132.1 response regulator [Pseudomonas chlororaphis]WEK11947.1 MAG: response regulator [Pseudomonas sp.]
MIPLLVCDDSSMARKQVLRTLPEEWRVSVTQASNGQEGLQAIRQGLGHVVLLDLTMPMMDGYQVLSAVREEGLDAQIIVISGDVQEEAVRRTRELGARAFLRKPFDPQELRNLLHELRLLEPPTPGLLPTASPAPVVSLRDAFRETINVSMGYAAALIAKVLDVFVNLPIPHVNILEAGELQMLLSDANRTQQLTAICQGYIGSGIAGEALLMFHDSEVADIARLMEQDSAKYQEMEVLIDLASVLIGACLSSIAEQLDVVFSVGHPQVLGEHTSIDELIRLNQQRWETTQAVEISYSLEEQNIHFDLLLLFTESSMELLAQKLSYLMN